jgi:hypothetical protein
LAQHQLLNSLLLYVLYYRFTNIKTNTMQANKNQEEKNTSLQPWVYAVLAGAIAMVLLYKLGKYLGWLAGSGG